jgi:hypothetical protein
MSPTLILSDAAQEVKVPDIAGASPRPAVAIAVFFRKVRRVVIDSGFSMVM